MGVKELLNLIGADPNEVIPEGLKEAQWLAKGDGERPTLPRCPASSKVCFSSESQAKQAMRNRLNKGANTSRLRTFKCDDCHQWHFTSSFR